MVNVPAASGRGHTVRSYDEEMSHLTSLIMQMGGRAEKQVADAMQALVERDPAIAAEVIRRDDKVDRLEEEIDQQVIRLLATRQPMAIDLRIIAMALKISNDLERMSDYAVSIAKRARRLAEQPAFKPLVTLPRITAICLGMVKDVLDAYVERDTHKAMDVWNRDEEVDQLYDGLFRELITYMLEDPRRISACTDYLFIAKNIERIGDHATNIAEKINYMIHGAQINKPRHDES
ncbi:phosphate signaling complex protein PhoU [Geminicoccaceae bacterium 1502E]|nr:phosphate signaling complex protein PhoU [Geminicoccaceae bacterium 1502E]